MFNAISIFFLSIVTILLLITRNNWSFVMFFALFIMKWIDDKISNISAFS